MEKPIKSDPRLTLRLLKALVKIPSVNPSIEPGEGEVPIANYIAKWFRQNGSFHVVEQRVEGDRFNVIATLPGKGRGRDVMLNGHMDTVGVSYMRIDPYHSLQKGGKLFARGSCDMKGALAAMMSACEAIAKKVRLEGELIFAAVVDEEHGGKGTIQLARKYRPGGAIVGEPTDLRIAIAHKGYAWFEVEVTGKEAHGSVPELGIDAIENAGKLLVKLQNLREQHSHTRHRLVGTPRIHTSTISGGTDWSTVPGKCILRLERRLIPGEKPSAAKRELERLIREVASSDSSFKAQVRLIYSAESMEVRESSPIVKVLRKHAKLTLGEVEIGGVPYWTDAATLVSLGKIPSCLFGPGSIDVAHSKDEYVKIRDTVIASQVYANTAADYCNSSRA